MKQRPMMLKSLMRSWFLAWLVLALSSLIASGAAAEKLMVWVSIPPQKYFVDQIGGENVQVNVLLKPGANPHTYEPKPRQMAALAEARIYFTIGLPFEDVWLSKIAAMNPKIAIVRTDANIQKRMMEGHRHQIHSAAPAGEHATPDPHIWLSPPLVRKQAFSILLALIQQDGKNKDTYEANFNRFDTSIEELDTDLKEMFRNMQGASFMVFHPAWGYFADAYGLKQMPVEYEGKAPKPAQLAALIQQARAKQVKAIFVQPQSSTKSASVLANEIGATLIVADPLAEDWAANLRQQAQAIKEALK